MISIFPKGLYISIIGTDGSGKTTTVSEVSKIVNNKGLKVKIVSGNRFKFQILPFNSLIKSKANNKLITNSLKYKKKSLIFKSTVTSIYYLEYLLRYFLIILPLRYSNDLIIMDRSFLDLYVSNNTNNKLTKIYCSLLPLPKHIFVWNDIEILYNRRGDEHTLEDLENQLEIYKSLSSYYLSSYKTNNLNINDQIAAKILHLHSKIKISQKDFHNP